MAGSAEHVLPILTDGGCTAAQRRTSGLDFLCANGKLMFTTRSVGLVNQHRDVSRGEFNLNAESILTTVAEVSIALAGFTGVVAVLGNRRNLQWSPEERLQLRTLVETSFTALFASFAPSILYLTLTSEPTVWKIANLFLGALHLTNLIAFLRRATDARPTASQKGLFLIGIGMILAHFLTAAGLIPWYVLIFVVGLLQQVFIAALNFVLLLFPVDDPD